MRERQIEQTLAKAVKAAGGIAPKFTSPGFAGMPDRLVLMPGGHIGFVLMFFLSCENSRRTWGPLAQSLKAPGAVKISTALPRGNGRGVSRVKKAKSKG